MKLKAHPDKGNVRKLKDKYDRGYGWGYGGVQHLFVVCVVDVFDPPWYLVHADNLDEAYEHALNCLVEDLNDDDEADIRVQLADGRSIHYAL